MSAEGVIALSAASLGVIISLVTLITFIRKSGENAQSIKDSLKSLDDWRKEDQKQLETIAEEIRVHIMDGKIHVNPVVEQRDYDARIRFQEEVKSKLQKLLEK